MSTVTSAEFQRNIGRYQDEALTQAVTITRNGRERVVLISVDEYKRLKRRVRQVMRIEELTGQDLSSIAQAEVPEAYRYLDNELE